MFARCFTRTSTTISDGAKVTYSGGAWPGAYSKMKHRQRCRGGRWRRAKSNARKSYHEQPQSDGPAATACRAYRQKYAEACGHSFAASESEPHRKHVADHGEDGGRHHPAHVAARPFCGDPHGEVALSGIEQQCEDCRRGPAVRATLAAPIFPLPDLADVAAPPRLHDQVAEGNRAEQVGDERDEPVAFTRVPWQLSLSIFNETEKLPVSYIPRRKVSGCFRRR